MIEFIKHRKLFAFISITTIIVMFTLVVVFGLKPSIDFTGGATVAMSSVEFQLEEGELLSEEIRDTVRKTFEDQQIGVQTITSVGESGLEVKAGEIAQNQLDSVTQSLKESYEDVVIESFQSVGPTVGREQLADTTTAVVLTAILLLLYIAWRFENRRFGVTAIIALLHDILVILGVFALLGYFWGVEVDIMFVTASLTAVAFSVHDTIVLYDRVREEQRRHPRDEYGDVVNRALNGTLVRSLSTSLSLVFVLLALLLLGGESIRWFVVALLVGTVSGAYSSPFTAAPLLVLWHDMRDK